MLIKFTGCRKRVGWSGAAAQRILRRRALCHHALDFSYGLAKHANSYGRVLFPFPIAAGAYADLGQEDKGRYGKKVQEDGSASRNLQESLTAVLLRTYYVSTYKST